MIWESGPWRRDLERDALLIAKWSAAKPTSRRDVLLEKKVFLTAYSARKLLEARKIPDKIGSETLKFQSHPVKAVPTWINWHKLDKCYDFSAKQTTSVTIRELTNLIIHSYVMIFTMSRSKTITGFFLASDRSRKSRILYVPIKHYVNLCKKIAAAEVSSFSWRVQQDGQEQVVVT